MATSDFQNIDILKDILNWLSISKISENIIQKMAERVNTQLPENFLLKCTRKYHKKWRAFSVNKIPILFLKYIREKYVFEVLGLHLTKNYFDPELCFKNYLTGLYLKKNNPIPYIMTTYEKGENIGKYDISNFKFLLGRQCYLHEVLSLYDVYDRHFIVRNENLCRIDFGRCFENIQKKYLGFHDYLKHKHLDYYDDEFQKGYNYEKEVIRNNLKDKKRDLSSIIRKIKTLKRDNILIFFYPDRFVNRLIDHWSRIGFLEDAQITQCEWI
jgi:hypothetical protein